MSTSSTPTFDIAEFKRERDVAVPLALHAHDAEVTLVDRINTPGSPRVLRGREEIRGWVEDICGRDMTHRRSRFCSVIKRATTWMLWPSRNTTTVGTPPATAPRS